MHRIIIASRVFLHVLIARSTNGVGQYWGKLELPMRSSYMVSKDWVRAPTGIQYYAALWNTALTAEQVAAVSKAMDEGTALPTDGPQAVWSQQW